MIWQGGWDGHGRDEKFYSIFIWKNQKGGDHLGVIDMN
jgi:hypothetical protein